MWSVTTTWLTSTSVILDDREIRECTSYILLSSTVSAPSVSIGFCGDSDKALDFIIKKLHTHAVTKIEGSKPLTPKPDIGHDTAPCKSRSQPHILLQCKMHYLPSPCQCFKWRSLDAFPRIIYPCTFPVQATSRVEVKVFFMFAMKACRLYEYSSTLSYTRHLNEVSGQPIYSPRKASGTQWTEVWLGSETVSKYWRKEESLAPARNWTTTPRLPRQ